MGDSDPSATTEALDSDPLQYTAARGKTHKNTLEHPSAPITLPQTLPKASEPYGDTLTDTEQRPPRRYSGSGTQDHATPRRPGPPPGIRTDISGADLQS